MIMNRLKRDIRELWVAEVDDGPVGFMLLEFETDDQNVEVDWLDSDLTIEFLGKWNFI